MHILVVAPFNPTHVRNFRHNIADCSPVALKLPHVADPKMKNGRDSYNTPVIRAKAGGIAYMYCSSLL